MKIFMFAVVLVSASCATNSGTPELESRLLSWTGSSIHDLAIQLGEPTTITKDSWEWRFTGPGMRAAPSTSSVSQSEAAHCSQSDPGLSTGCPSSPGMEGKTWTPSIDSRIPRKECLYRVGIDGVSIVQIETLVVSGRCQFSEIPLQTRN